MCSHASWQCLGPPGIVHEYSKAWSGIVGHAQLCVPGEHSLRVHASRASCAGCPHREMIISIMDGPAVYAAVGTQAFPVPDLYGLQ